ncbi:antibiotic biosynthesis monooxygenase [Dyadobacter sp. CY261]|uniref:putative quinol monooxygenase n=1 Tax=Dyadobacter sp. CY261 TaxID=2907203 RepID=UPI001F41330D|nr:putative quinol monooxygenase [Dyadobacter sp. CY261]MCF0074728.1 antibiotic biosynthesis monooxygenase [Dyadobacter sp. CY261]
MPIYLTAVIKSKADYRDEVRETLLNLVTESRKEAACLQYDLYQDDTDPNVFVFQEIWESREALEEHNRQPYLRAFVASFDKLQHDPEVYLTQPIAKAA